MISVLGHIEDKHILEAIADELEVGDENDPIEVVGRSALSDCMYATIKLRSGKTITAKCWVDIAPDAELIGLFASIAE